MRRTAVATAEEADDYVSEHGVTHGPRYAPPTYGPPSRGEAIRRAEVSAIANAALCSPFFQKVFAR